MNEITKRSTPAIRYKIQGIMMAEKLNAFLKGKKTKDQLYYILLLLVTAIITKRNEAVVAPETELSIDKEEIEFILENEDGTFTALI